jgi:hypothetical protein
MSYLILPKRVFNSPLIQYVNFEDGSFINVIKLNKPYANGISFAVYETTKSAFCSNGLFKTIEKAQEKFNLMVKNASRESKVFKSGTIDHNKPFKATDYES